MIEQTEVIVTEWKYHPPLQQEPGSKISSNTELEVMRKRAADKKGIACRIRCVFRLDGEPVLECSGEHSYVIDLGDHVDTGELRKIFRNTFEQFKEKFDLRKLNTLLRDTSLTPLDETKIDFDSILPLLV
jgi:hypothetical protein